MITKGDICFTGALDLMRAYRERIVSPVEVMEAVLARIDAVNPRINALVTIEHESALAQAQAAARALESGGALGPLHGVPVSIKDVTPTRGMRTTFGSRIYEDFVPDQDALVVERLKGAGAIIIGKTNTPEFGAGGHTFNRLFGPTRNPWNPKLSAGGSSGGAAAAVAAGMGPLAQGSDLGGSLRIPAAYCGVVGLRSTPGLIPRYPTLNAWDSLTVDGPIARSTADAALMLSVLAGPDDRAPLSYPVCTDDFLGAVQTPSVAGWRIAWTPDLNGLLPVDARVVEAAERGVDLFESLGASVESACPDFAGLEDIVLGTRGLSMVLNHADKLDRWRSVMQDGLVWNIEQGLRLSSRDIARAQRLRTELWHRVRRFMQRYDLLILPGTAVPPFPVETAWPDEIAGTALKNYTEWFYVTYAISLTALPVICVPCGFTREGMPAGLQIVGRRRGEVEVLRAAAAFESAAPWAGRRPDIAALSAGT